MRNLTYYLAYGIAIVQSMFDILCDLKHGRYFGGFVRSRFEHLGAHGTQSSNYYVLNAIFRKYQISAEDVLVEVGCGKGRVIHWWLTQGYKNRIIGIEIDEDIASKTAKIFKKNKKVQIIAGNAIENIPVEGTVFYIYNPFNEEVLRAFKDRLKHMFLGKRDITLIYVNYQYLSAFSHDPAWDIHYTRYCCQPDFDGLDLHDEDEIDLGISYPVAILTLKRPDCER